MKTVAEIIASPDVGKARLASLIGAYAIVHALANWAGNALLFPGLDGATLWPANALLLGTLWVTPRRLWLAIGGAALVGDLTTRVIINPDQSMAWAPAFSALNVIEPTLLALLLRRMFRGRRFIGSVAGSAMLLVGSAAVCGITGAFAAIALAAAGSTGRFLLNWQLWWAGNYLGIVVLTPLVISLLRPWQLPPPVRNVPLWESALIAITALGTAWIVFGSMPAAPMTLLDLEYALFPPLLWATFRSKPPELLPALLALITLIAVLHTMSGHGPFAYPHVSPFAEIYSLQIFLALTNASVLITSAAVLERRRGQIGLRSARDSLAEQRTRLRRLAVDLMLADERARRQTAVDLHDGLAQNLAAIIMWQDIARERGEGANDEMLDHILDATQESVRITREMIADLSPPSLLEGDLSAALGWLATQVRDRHGLDVRIERCELPPDFDPDTQVTLFQCVRELLSNVVRHAGANSVSVTVSPQGDVLSAVVADDGGGFDETLVASRPHERGRFGLSSIRERLSALDGSLSIDTGGGRGTRATITLPAA